MINPLIWVTFYTILMVAFLTKNVNSWPEVVATVLYERLGDQGEPLIIEVLGSRGHFQLTGHT